MSSDVSRRSSAVVSGKKMRKRKELDALTGTVVNVNRNRRLMCSSDSDSCSSSRAPTPIKLRRQITRRRKRNFVSNTWCSALRMFLMFGCVLWVVFETYTFFDIRKIQVHLQTQLDEVAAGNRGVPDDLQKCHAMAQQLKINQTDISQHLIVYDGQIANLTLQVSNLGLKLLSIEKKIDENINLMSNPDATKDPTVKELLSEVAKLGSNYEDLSDNVKSLKKTTDLLQSHQTTLQTNITSINEKINGVKSVKTDETMIKNVSEKFHKIIENLNNNITKTNQNFTNYLGWLTTDEKSSLKEIDMLKENSQKLIAQVKTIENECKTTDNTLMKSLNEINSKIISLKTQIDTIATNVTNLYAQSSSNDYASNLSQLKGEKNGTQTKS